MEDKEWVLNNVEKICADTKNIDEVCIALEHSTIFITETIQSLVKEIDKLQQQLSTERKKLKKIEELFENTIENNKYSYLSKLRDEQCFAIGNNEICRKGLSIIKGGKE